jgi:hypothetical protein
MIPVGVLTLLQFLNVSTWPTFSEVVQSCPSIFSPIQRLHTWVREICQDYKADSVGIYEEHLEQVRATREQWKKI